MYVNAAWSPICVFYFSKQGQYRVPESGTLGCPNRAPLWAPCEDPILLFLLFLAPTSRFFDKQRFYPRKNIFFTLLSFIFRAPRRPIPRFAIFRGENAGMRCFAAHIDHCVLGLGGPRVRVKNVRDRVLDRFSWPLWGSGEVGRTWT